MTNPASIMKKKNEKLGYPSTYKNVEMAESKIPISTCRLQGATLRKVRSLKHTEIRPSDDISYVIKKDCG